MKKILACLLAAFLLLAIFTITALATDNGEDDRIEAIDAAIVDDGPADDAEATVTTYVEPEPETIRASKNYTTGIIFDEGGSLYEATSNISRGEKIIPGMNCKTMSLSDILNTLNSQGG